MRYTDSGYPGRQSWFGKTLARFPGYCSYPSIQRLVEKLQTVPPKTAAGEKQSTGFNETAVCTYVGYRNIQYLASSL
jgi:hypothetical protein